MNLKKSMAALLMLVAMVSFTAMDRTLAYDPSGTWTYDIETPDGAISGEMEVEKADKSYKVTVVTDDFGDLELEDVEFEAKKDGGSMTASVDVQGVTAEFEVDFEGDAMSGVIIYGGEELPIEAERD